MATVSARLDDELKTKADSIADEIGISLSTAISVFLKQFVACEGFPFQVVSPKATNKQLVINKVQLDEAVHLAATDPGYIPYSGPVSYVDPNTKKLITTK